MQPRRWAILIPIALLLVAMFSNPVRYPAATVAQECVGIHADSMPRDKD